MITLRPYQQQAVDAVYDHLRNADTNPCVVIPTAGGKTPVMATICRDTVQRWNGRVLILAHVKELLEQAVDKLHVMAPDLWNRIGVYSAGLNSRDTQQPIIVAGIQSVYQRADQLGSFDLVLIDEAHLIPPDGDGMYQTFLADAMQVNRNVRLIGLTATPYRMSTGMICGPDNLLHEVCYEVGVRELINQGYLCSLKSKAGKSKVDTSGLHLRGGEFIPAEVDELMDAEQVVEAACREIVELTADRRSVLIFASSVAHALHVQDALYCLLGVECGVVTGETSGDERAATLKRFTAGDLKYLANVNVLTTGFDAPNIDAIALLRPTNSPGLYYQMVGRGFRLCEGKQDCLILDYGGNVLRHGPVDMLEIRGSRGRGTGQAPAKECPQCDAIIHTAYTLCPECGYEFPPPERKRHSSQADISGVLSGETTDTEYDVFNITYDVHYKKDAPDDHPPTMKVGYWIGANAKYEWVCFEHTGFARRKAVQWWTKRSREPVPATVDEAIELCEAGCIADTVSITVRRTSGQKYTEIVGHTLGEIPEQRVSQPSYAAIDETEIPF